MGGKAPLVIGRYVLCHEVARGGMATVYLGRMQGAVGFTRVVAIKRLHPQFATDPEFAAMFLDEARLAGRARHPNVVATLDAVANEEELFLVMELVHGSSIAQLAKQLALHESFPTLAVWSSIMSGALQGLHAAHEARDELGNPLGIIHRDVSPQNILVGLDGVARMIDFGVAKAIGQTHHTREGHIKGKLGYMAPEQLLGGAVDARVDIFAAGVVLWELVTQHRLFFGSSEGAIIRQVLDAEIPDPSSFNPDVSPELEAVILRALARDPEKRFATAAEMAAALEAALPPLTPMQIADWVRETDGERLARFAEDVAAVEAMALSGTVEVTPRPEPVYVVASPPSSRKPAILALFGAAALAVGVGAWASARPEKGAIAPVVEGNAVAPAASVSVGPAPLDTSLAATTPSAGPAASSSAPSPPSVATPEKSAQPPAPAASAAPPGHRAHPAKASPRASHDPAAATPLYSRD